MKRRLAVIGLLVFCVPLFAQDQRTIKRDLIRELLNVIDAKALTQSTLDVIFEKLGQPQNAEALKTMSADERQQYDASMKKYSDMLRTYRERLYSRIDYAKYADEIYAPVFDKTFNADELRQLIAFYKTPVGQKTAKTIPEFTIGSLLRGSEMMTELGNTIRQEMENEEKAANPWKQTMADLRTVATATEAYATDENKYPNVRSYGDLKPILSPVYVKTLPEKDAWGTPYMYVVSADGQHYRFVSAGADKRFDWNASTIETMPENYQGKPSASLDADIIFQDGLFIQYPAVSKNDQ